MKIWEIMEWMQGEIAGELRSLLGEAPYDQSLFDGEQRKRRIEAMRRVASSEGTEADRHDQWCEAHIAEGWTYGEEFDPGLKRHPNLQPWDILPDATRAKIRIFAIVSKAAKAIEDYERTNVFPALTIGE